MSLLHPVLLFGLGLAAIPILLHLLLKAKPKRLIFPALRLIQQNRRQNVRRLQLRHLWLLLLRIGVIVLIVIAITRPSLPAANYALAWHEWLRLFVVIGVGLGAYYGILAWWKRHSWSRNQFLTRRTILRGGAGAGTALLALLVVFWPYARRVAAEIKDPAPRVAENIPAAAIFLFDTSASMGYREENQTRLQKAQQIARDYLGKLPQGSKVAVAGSHEITTLAFSLDLQSARSRIDSHEIKAVTQPLNDRLRASLLVQEDDLRRVTAEQNVPEDRRQDRYLREIYLFTDLARSAWREESSSALRDEMERLKNVAVYVIDVGELTPSNVGITSIHPSRETVPQGGSVRLDVALSAIGNVKSEQTVECLLYDADGKQVKAGQQTTAVDAGLEKRLTFEIPRVSGRYQQGEVRIVGSDPLTIDDVGYFTVQTLQPLKVLVIAEFAAVAQKHIDALNYLASANLTGYKPTYMSASRLNDADLRPFDLVCLVNLASPDETTWTKLHNYVSSGGGLAVFLGSDSSAIGSKSPERIDPVAYNSDAAKAILPAELLAAVTFKTPQFMELRNTQHPLLKRFDELNALTELGATEILKCWNVKPHDVGIVIARYSGPREIPALIERRVGEGRVMMMTTSIDKQDWNLLVGTPWYLVIADQLMQYLSQQASLRCNEIVGNEISLPLDHERRLRKIILRMPDFKQRTQDVSTEAKTLLLRDLTTIGSYQVDSAESEVDYHTAFSLNLPGRESDLKRLETADLDLMLGEGRYKQSRDLDNLIKEVDKGRLGQEVYGLVVAVLVGIFAMEQFTATWFYRTDEV